MAALGCCTGGLAEAVREKLGHKKRRQMCPVYVSGLIGPGDRKSIEPMAERLAPDRYDRLHHFISDGIWEAGPLEAELAVQADKLVGASDAFLVINDTGLPKKGDHSVGVAPQAGRIRMDGCNAARVSSIWRWIVRRSCSLPASIARPPSWPPQASSRRGSGPKTRMAGQLLVPICPPGGTHTNRRPTFTPVDDRRLACPALIGVAEVSPGAGVRC